MTLKAIATATQTDIPHLREYDISRYMERQPSRVVIYRCEGGRTREPHEFGVRLHDAVETQVPLEWQCAQHSVTAVTGHPDAVIVDDVYPGTYTTKDKNRPSHLDTLLERRTPEELDAVVNLALIELAAKARMPVIEYLGRSRANRGPVEVRGNISNRRRRWKVLELGEKCRILDPQGGPE
jgi:hypothetical protein